MARKERLRPGESCVEEARTGAIVRTPVLAVTPAGRTSRRTVNGLPAAASALGGNAAAALRAHAASRLRMCVMASVPEPAATIPRHRISFKQLIRMCFSVYQSRLRHFHHGISMDNGDICRRTFSANLCIDNNIIRHLYELSNTSAGAAIGQAEAWAQTFPNRSLNMTQFVIPDAGTLSL